MKLIKYYFNSSNIVFLCYINIIVMHSIYVFIYNCAQPLSLVLEGIGELLL